MNVNQFAAKFFNFLLGGMVAGFFVAVFISYAYVLKTPHPITYDGPTCPAGWTIESVGQSEIQERPSGTEDRVYLWMVCVDIKEARE